MQLTGIVRTQTRNETLQICDEVSESNVLVLDEPTEEQTFSYDISTLAVGKQSASDKESLAAATSDLRDFIAFEFSLVPQVEYVFTAFRENQVFYAWIVVDEFETSVRASIYARQRAIIDEFPMFEFDFYIIARMGRSLDDLVGGGDSMHLTYARK